MIVLQNSVQVWIPVVAAAPGNFLRVVPESFVLGTAVAVVASALN